MAHNHAMSAVDQLAYQSGLRTWNSKGKAGLALAGIIVVITCNAVLISAGTMLFMACLTMLAGKVKAHDYLAMLSIPALFIITGALTVLIQYGAGSDSLVRYAVLGQYLYITPGSLMQAVQLATKAFGAISCLYMLALSTPMGDLIGVLQELHLPNLLVELMHSMYHYIFMLFEINRKQKEACASRLGYRDYPTAIRTFGKELANLLVLSLKKADECYDAIQSRKGDELCLFWYESYPLSKMQLLWSGMYGIVIAVLLMLQ